MEVVSVGVMYYAALVPCVISSLVAHAVAEFFGVSQEMFLIGQIPAFKITSAVKISVLAILLCRCQHYFLCHAASVRTPL